MSDSKAYEEFLASKRLVVAPAGIDNPPDLHPRMFPFQRAVTRWALRRGRGALWLSTGLGKSLCALEWARVVSEHTEQPTLIVTPLAVAQLWRPRRARRGDPHRASRFLSKPIHQAEPVAQDRDR